MTEDAGICIIGAGLSGLALAWQLQRAGRAVRVLDARDRVGGRILSDVGFDLGPSWVWPQNRRLLGLIAALGLTAYPQHTAGRLVFEPPQGAIRRDLEMATMGGALRVAGGLAQVSQGLAQALGDALHLSQPVTRLVADAAGVTLVTAAGRLRAGHVVLALPPRLMAGLGVAVPDVPTWMAGQAKLVAVYPTAFWRAQGLNGDAISHRGPLAEIHDATPMDLHCGALFGFVHPGAARAAGLEQAAVAQLVRLFGPEAAHPQRVMVKDWSADPATATAKDLAHPQGHPAYRPIAPTGRIIFAGSETASTDGGYLEGALAAAERAFALLMQ